MHMINTSGRESGDLVVSIHKHLICLVQVLGDMVKVRSFSMRSSVTPFRVAVVSIELEYIAKQASDKHQRSPPTRTYVRHLTTYRIICVSTKHTPSKPPTKLSVFA